MPRFSPEIITQLPPNGIFVFGSNVQGIHGCGAAKQAVTKFGAVRGQASGLQGRSYAIITKDLRKGVRSIPLTQIEVSIVEFLAFARERSDLEFYVTAIGCGYSGYTKNEIAPLFNGKNIPDNVLMPPLFASLLSLSPKIQNSV